MRASASRSLVFWIAGGLFLLWYFLPQILLWFLPTTSTVEATDGLKVGDTGLDFGSGDVGPFTSGPPKPPTAPK